LFAKSKKKIYLPVDGGFDKLTNNWKIILI
jgi:hypothetical protein